MMPHKVSIKPGWHSGSGFSLVELMIAIVIVGIFMSAVLTMYVGFLSGSGEQAAMAKRSADTRLGLILMRRDIRNAGFGIAVNQPGNATLDITDAVAGNASNLTILSTAVHTHANAGLHGVIAENASVSDGMGGSIPEGLRGIRMTPNREQGEVKTAGNLTANEANNLFFVGNQDGGEPYYYRRTYELSNPCAGADCGECAEGTSNLKFNDANGGAGPIIDCVRDLRFRYGFEDNSGGIQVAKTVSNSLTNLEDQFPDLVKVGVIVQSGDERSSVSTPSPVTYSDPDFSGVSVTLNADQQRYRWLVEEFSVPLESLE